MRVAVIGAGVVGAITADMLAEQGCTITVFDAHTQPALGASQANGGQLSYSFTDAMACPDLLRKIPGIMLARESGLRIRLRADLGFLNWGIRFLANCTHRRFSTNSNQLLQIAMSSIVRMNEYHEQFGCTYNARQAGKLVLPNDQISSTDRERIAIKQADGCDVRIVTAEETLQIEPALAHWRSLPQTAIYSPGDEVGDAHKFTQTLLRQLESKGVTLKLGQSVSKLLRRSDQTWEVLGDHCLGQFDALVVCTGTTPVHLLKPLGIHLPIYSVAGYSATLPAGPRSAEVSITALEQKIVFSRLGDQIRIAGFADMNMTPVQEGRRQLQLLSLAESIAPKAAEYQSNDASLWTGYRPMTPTSVPFVGATKIPGLYLNLGHGMLGWTLAAGSAAMVAQTLVATNQR